jgi:hypothetical protein
MSQAQDPFARRAAADAPSIPDELAWTLQSPDSFVRAIATDLARFLSSSVTRIEGPMYLRLRTHEGHLRLSLGFGTDDSASQDFKLTL